jgi:hypothetical protein
LAGWRGHLDDYGSYKAGIPNGITEVGYWIYARRKLPKLTERKDNPIAQKLLCYIATLRDIEHRGNDS